MDHAVNWEAISAIGQIVGAIAVVISLIYVAREVRNSARARNWLRGVRYQKSSLSCLDNSQSIRI